MQNFLAALNSMLGQERAYLKAKFGGKIGEAGWGFEQPGLVGDVPAYCRGLELDDLKGPFQPRAFYDSIISQVVLFRELGRRICNQ